MSARLLGDGDRRGSETHDAREVAVELVDDGGEAARGRVEVVPAALHCRAVPARALVGSIHALVSKCRLVAARGEESEASPARLGVVLDAVERVTPELHMREVIASVGDASGRDRAREDMGRTL